ncbi:hypothetical protein CHF27_001045 [Romboutsia maritimum]|uniref:Uncharacterized protein n=1 Tax=Romboutsia maritimum TaxID=2020948 RepID=A0A371IWF7_9FIRM|nr:hypothetical protein [Romboutsia maritimum]RDY24814.1 hypothetical protein CHF27_001045 [Romboutsia maritimum]
MMCINLIYTNNNIHSLDFKNINMKEESLSAIEIVYSNILREVKNAVELSENKEEFREYFLGNNYYKFINNIEDISKSSLKNITLKFSEIDLCLENEILQFDIVSKVKNENYKKTIKVNVNIKNPWYTKEKDIEKENEVKNNEETKNNHTLENTDLIQSDHIKSVESIEIDNQNQEILEDINIKLDIDEKDLVTIYDYKEI